MNDSERIANFFATRAERAKTLSGVITGVGHDATTGKQTYWDVNVAGSTVRVPLGIVAPTLGSGVAVTLEQTGSPSAAAYRLQNAVGPVGTAGVYAFPDGATVGGVAYPSGDWVFGNIAGGNIHIEYDSGRLYHRVAGDVNGIEYPDGAQLIGHAALSGGDWAADGANVLIQSTGIQLRNALVAALMLDATNGIRMYSGATQRVLIKPDGTGWLGGADKLSWDEAGNITLAGVLTAEAGGSIGGWTVGTGHLYTGSGSGRAGLRPADYPFYAGAEDPASAPFSVTTAGALIASSSTITGTVNALAGYFGDSANRVAIEAAGLNVGNTGVIRGGQTAFDTGSGFWLGYSGGYKFSIGNGTKRLTYDGTNLRQDGVIIGSVAAGTEPALQGWQMTCVFSSTSATVVSWGAGQFILADGTTAYNIAAGNTGTMAAKTYVYWDKAVSTTAFQVTTTAATAIGSGKVLIAVAVNGTVEARFQVFSGYGGLKITGGDIEAKSIYAEKLFVTAGGANLLLNSSMQVDSNSDGLANGFAIYNNGPEVVSAYSVQTSGGVDGRGFQRIEWTVANTSSKGLLTYSSLGGGVQGGWRASTTYIISWWAKGDATLAAYNKAMFTTSNVGFTSITYLNNPNLSTAWQHYSARVVTAASPASDRSLHISVAYGQNQIGKLDIDHVQVEQADTLSSWKPYPSEIEPGSIIASYLSATAIDGMTITGPVIRTANDPAPRTELNSSNLFGLGFGGIGGTDGTTPQWYAKSSDGKLYAGGGKVSLDAEGFRLSESYTGIDTALPTYIKWTGVGGIDRVTMQGSRDNELAFDLPQTTDGAYTFSHGHLTALGYFGGYLRALADSTTALQLQNASGTAVVTVDTTNNDMVLTTGAGPQNDSSLVTRAYARSANFNLFTNGDGLMGIPYNLPGTTLDRVDKHGGMGSFKFPLTAYSTYTSSEYLPVDLTKSYAVSMWLKAGNIDSSEYNASNTQYVGFAAYDADNLFILPHMCSKFVGATDTTLAAQLTTGATTMTLANATGWQNAGAGYERNISWWPYTNSFGYAYPDYTYTRNTSFSYSDYDASGLWAAGGISGNVVTLRSAWAGPTLPAGTAIRNTTSGSTYRYLISGAVGNAWAQTAAVISGEDTAGAQVATKFPTGTNYIKLVWLVNFHGAANTRLRVSQIELRPISNPGYVGGFWRPAADSTTALQLQNAAGTAVVTVDTTNGRLGINTTPSYALDVNGSARIGNSGGSIGFFAGTPVVRQAHITDPPANWTVEGADPFNGNFAADLATWINVHNDKFKAIFLLLEAYNLMASS